jgi:CheY-like chemotaxis protein
MGITAFHLEAWILIYFGIGLIRASFVCPKGDSDQDDKRSKSMANVRFGKRGRIKKKKILIVDDEVAFTTIVKLTLERTDTYEVFVENNPSLAIATSRKFSPDIVFLDVVMPELDGGEVHTQFMADPILKHIPVMFLTATVGQKEVDEHHGMIDGAFYLAKPVGADELINAVEEYTW